MKKPTWEKHLSKKSQRKNSTLNEGGYMYVCVDKDLRSWIGDQLSASKYTLNATINAMIRMVKEHG